MSIKDGGPAFPHQHDHVLYRADDPTKPAQTIKGFWTGGMTLRDYFAAKASDADIEEYLNGRRTRQAARYCHADAMLRARENQE